MFRPETSDQIEREAEAEGWVWVRDDGWEYPSDGRTCSMIRCQNTSVATMLRRAYYRDHSQTRRYHYCADHLYGRRIHDGQVEILVHPDSKRAKAAA